MAQHADPAALPDIDATKSPNDRNKYRLIRLDNGLEALLVSTDDARVVDTAGALACGVGYLSDPQGRCEGLSHFLEHMIFMGSKKYPGENEAEAYLSEHGGSSNACTEAETTVYNFNVHKDHLHKALDMFAGYFVSPLMRKDSTDREVRAIESEFRRAQVSDSCRSERLLQLHCLPGHPYRTFGWGSLQSLITEPGARGVDVHEELHKHFQRYYKAPRMRLCLYGAEPLDSLEGAVRASFSDIEKGEADFAHLDFAHKRLPFADPLPRLFRVRPVKDVHRLEIYWALPPQKHNFRARVPEVVAHAVGHEGTGSILAVLKERGLATELSAGGSDEGFDFSTCCAVFSVCVTLTARGLERWGEVGAVIFQFLALLRSKGAEALRYVHDQVRKVKQISYRFQEERDPTDLVYDLAQFMLPSQYPIENVLNGRCLADQWMPEQIDDWLSRLTPERCIVLLLSASYGRAAPAESGSADDGGSGEEGEEGEEDEDGGEGAGSGGAAEGAAEGAAAESAQPPRDPHLPESETPQEWQREQYFSTEYLETELPEAVLRDWRAAQPTAELCLPPDNPYIATSFDLRPPEAPEGQDASGEGKTRVTAALHGGGAVRLWHVPGGTRYKVPKAALRMRLTCGGRAPPGIRSSVALGLWEAVLSDALTETLWLAEEARLDLSVDSVGGGLELSLDGFDDKLWELADTALAAALRCGHTEWWAAAAGAAGAERFGAQREALARRWSNTCIKPGTHVRELRRTLLLQGHHLQGERAAELRKGSDQDWRDTLRELSAEFAASAEAEGMVYGNVDGGDSEKLLERVLSRRLPGARRAPSATQVARLPKRAALCVVPSDDPGARNSAVEVYWQCGEKHVGLSAWLSLLRECMYEPLFDELRTKQTLGYTVACADSLLDGVCGFYVKVESSAFSASHCVDKALEFVRGYPDTLAEMTKESFDSRVKALRDRRLEPAKNVEDAAGQLWGCVRSRSYDFSWEADEAAALQRITQSDFVAAARQMFSSPPLVVAVVGPRSAPSKPPPEERVLLQELLAAQWPQQAPLVVDSPGDFHGAVGHFPPLC
eukprot:TRINITY_DN3432_c0_g2_i1.p1 TRINITY_DN3432_c0_g2~~TRINITY_DN3432_c0_g2_i1.p1  ORF type:complete len:1064 (+),score=297.61 TRINITY_DN3432_c0_g2_i1:119-3310(+)